MLSCGLAVESRKQNCHLPCTPMQADDESLHLKCHLDRLWKIKDLVKTTTQKIWVSKRTSKHGSPTALLPFRACCKRLRSFREEAHVETPEHDIIIMFCETRRMVCETRKLGIKANHVRPNSR